MGRIARTMVQYHKSRGGAPGMQQSEEAIRRLAKELNVLESTVDTLVVEHNELNRAFRQLERSLDAYLNPTESDKEKAARLEEADANAELRKRQVLASGITMSDRSLKEHVTLVGKSLSGINIYEFSFIDKKYGEGRYRGVMAQEVPQASTIHPNGYLIVDYNKIDVDIERIDKH